MAFPRSHDRGRIEALRACRFAPPSPSFPRSHDRGRIEASTAPARPLGQCGFPRSHDRGRIEATSDYNAAKTAASPFHGHMTVAALKLPGLGPRR